MSFLLLLKMALFHSNNVMMFESSPDLSSNTFPVFEEFINRGYNKKYFLVWKIRKPRKYKRLKNVFYWVEGKKYHFFKKCLYHFLFKHIKVNVCCNGFLLPRNNKQTSFYLTHGTFIKNVRSYYNIPKEMNYVLVSSKEAGNIISETANFPYPDRIIVTGYPYNDDLTKSNVKIGQLFVGSYDKYIVWYPTYKQHKSSKTASTAGKPIAIIDNYDNALRINNFLKKNNSLLIVKPHFAQDLSIVKQYKLSNIIFITDDFFYNNNISSYGFVAACDALITDYSAIYFDYLICDKQIGVVWEDIEEYKKFPGFCVDIDKAMAGATKIYNANDFIDFISNVVNGVDSLSNVRKQLCRIYNLSTDGNNASRVVNFIERKCELKL